MKTKKPPTLKPLYEAVGKVNSKLFPRELYASGWNTYEALLEDMYEKTQDIRYYTESVGSTTKKESYTKDLIWPEVKWKIKRNEREI
jgi:hypothetical protein